MTHTTIHATVSGRVQGVFYRDSTCQKAQQLGLTGWVRNLPDGRVELVAQGHETALNALQAWLWQGPPLAKVSAVEVELLETAQNYPDFSVRFD